MSKQISAQSPLYQLIEPIVVKLGYLCWGIEFFTYQGEKLLRVYIDSPNGILIEDCEKVSHQLSGVLDVENLINDNYRLEISSPGLDRSFFNLKQMQDYVGEKVKLKLRQALQGKRKYTGILTKVDIEKNFLDLREENAETVSIDFQQIESAKLEF